MRKNKSAEKVPRVRLLHGVAALCLLFPIQLFSLTANGETNPYPVAGEIRLQPSPAGWSLRAHQAELHQVLNQLARQANLDVISHVPLDDKVTLAFQDLPLPEAISRLLRDYSFALRYSTQADWSGEEGPNNHRPGNRLVIFTTPLPSVADSVNSPPLYIPGQERWQWQLQLTNGSEGDRLDALVALAEEESDNATDAILVALQDPAARVRAEAVALLGEAGESESVTLLEQGINDVDRRVQQAALLALGDIGGEAARRALQRALAHPQANIRRTAAKQLLHFDE